MKNLAVGVLCPLVLVLTACGGGGSSGGKPKSSSSAAVSSAAAVSSVAPASSAAAVSSVAPASSAAAVSSVAPVSSAAVSSSSDSSVSSSAASSSSVVAQTGVFVDSAVAGISYQTTPGNFSGVTSPTGQYQYAEGDSVVFSIGAISLPSVTAKGVVTPVDMKGTGSDQVVTNIAVLLQSLDADGDPSNGISIPSAALSAATTPVVFDQSYADFATAVLPVVRHTDSAKLVVDETAAVEHLEGSLSKLLVGTWYIHGTSGADSYDYVLFVLDEENYAALDHDSGDTRIERGTYSWNQATGVVTVNPTFGNPSDLDVYPPMANGNTLVLEGNVLKLSDADETFELARLVPTEESPLKGGWFIGNEVVFAFTDNLYVMGQFEGEGAGGEPGLELGTYSYNTETKAITYETQVDFNGQWGLSHPCGVLNHNDQHPEYEESNYLNCGVDGAEVLQTMEVTGDTLTFISEADTINNDGEEDPVPMERVVDGVPDGDIHLKLELTLTLEAFDKGNLYEIMENGQVVASMQCARSEDPEFIETITPGYVEVYNESWVLGGTEGRPTWITSIPATYNPATGAITLDADEPLKPIPGHPGFFERWETTFNGIYQSGNNNVVEGDLTEVNHLSWDRDDRVSSCTALYSVVGKLRPVSEQLPPP